MSDGKTNFDGLLSEAACGGATECIAFLIERGAQPNAVGEHRRTPLHRAAGNGFAHVLPMLLEYGCDPRMLFPLEYEAPSELYPNGRKFLRAFEKDDVDRVLECPKECKQVLKEWDIRKTINILARRQLAQEKEKLQRQRQLEEKESNATERMAELELELAEAREKRQQAFRLREHRILDYDTAKCEGKKLDAEAFKLLERLIQEAFDEELLARSKVQMLEEELRKAGKDAREANAALNPTQWDQTIPLKQVEDVVIRDIGDVLAKSGKLCLVIDSTEAATSLFNYRAGTCDPCRQRAAHGSESTSG